MSIVYVVEKKNYYIYWLAVVLQNPYGLEVKGVLDQL